MIVRGFLLPLLLAACVAAPARAQGLEAIGDWFLYQPKAAGQREGLILMSLGDQERGMLLVFSCPREQLGVALVPREGAPAEPVRLSWRLDADSAHTGDALRTPAAPGALVFPLERSLELTRGVAASSWLVMRLIPRDGAERAWAYSLADAGEALRRLSCVAPAREADPPAWRRRDPIPMTTEVREVQGEPPPTVGPPPSAGPPEDSGSSTPRLLNAEEAERMMRAGYPELLRDAGVTGRAVMELMLKADGTVERASLVSVTAQLFRRVAYDTAESLRFSAPSAAGARVRVRLHFDLPTQRVEVVRR